MTFRDIFKSSFLENMDSVPLLDMAIALLLSFLLGLFIFAIYKQCYAGVMYSPSFGVTLVALSLITTLLILTVVSNIVLSLGMVGALSIVRFRTAVKEPMDIAFLFWAIAVGIVLAAGLLVLAGGRVRAVLDPAADPPQQLERRLAAVYGAVSLHRCADRSGRQQLVLLKEPEGCGTIDP